MICLDDLLSLFSRGITRTRTGDILTREDVCYSFKTFVEKYFIIRKRGYSKYSRANVILWLSQNIMNIRPHLLEDLSDYGWDGWRYKPHKLKKSDILNIFINDIIVADGYSALSTKQLIKAYVNWSRMNIRSAPVDKKKFIKYVIRHYFKKKPVKYNYFRGWLGYTVTGY